MKEGEIRKLIGQSKSATLLHCRILFSMGILGITNMEIGESIFYLIRSITSLIWIRCVR